MIGITAAASGGIYFTRGDIHPLIAAPVVIGVLLGAYGGASLMARMRLTGRVLSLDPLGTAAELRRLVTSPERIESTAHVYAGAIVTASSRACDNFAPREEVRWPSSNCPIPRSWRSAATRRSAAAWRSPRPCMP